KQPSRRIKRWRTEIRASVVIRDACRCRFRLSGEYKAIVENNGSAIPTDFARPLRLRERLCKQQLPGCAIEHIEESVAAGDHRNFALTALHRDIREDGDLVSVPIV